VNGDFARQIRFAKPLEVEHTDLSETALAALSRPRAYPHDPSAAQTLETIQTHISHVFLTGKRVYKFRKAVDLGFVCFSSRDQRNADCLREIALNRRLAADVYLGLAPLLASPDGYQVGPVAPGLAPEMPDAEHCVVMRRLPSGRDALSLLQTGHLDSTRFDPLARILARFHREYALGTPAPFSPEAWRARCIDPVRANLDSLAAADAGVAPPEIISRLRKATGVFEQEHSDCFECRRLAGRAVDGHGDLHLQHVWFDGEDADPVVIDCLEFNESLRCIDAASDVAFLAMDLSYRGADSMAARFLRQYAAESDDFDLYMVIDYFVSYRAAVRAKVAAISAGDVQITEEQRARAAESARRHLVLSDQALAPRDRGQLILVGGAVGTGKTSVAAALADAIDGVVISSDRVRKHLLGLAPTDRAAPAAYNEQQKARVYDGLLARAEPVVKSGRSTILDATFGLQAQRERALDWARDNNVPAHFIETRCSPEIAIERLGRRAADGLDASDAGPALYRPSAMAFQRPTEWPEGSHRVVETDTDCWAEELRRIAADLQRDG
jgi:aminoglycoside phosphotransferase family enzyme/predicted kinase